MGWAALRILSRAAAARRAEMAAGALREAACGIGACDERGPRMEAAAACLAHYAALLRHHPRAHANVPRRVLAAETAREGSHAR